MLFMEIVNHDYKETTRKKIESEQRKTMNNCARDDDGKANLRLESLITKISVSGLANDLMLILLSIF